MKILSLSNKMPYPPKDGGTIGIYNIVDSLGSVGNEVHVLAINTPKHYISHDQIPDEVRKKLHLESVFLKTDISFFGLIRNLLFSRLPYMASRFYSAQYEEKLIDLLQQHNYDIVQFEGLYMCVYIDVVKNNSNALISLRSHNIEHEIWQRTANNEKNYVKRKYLQLMTKRIVELKKRTINKYDLLIPITERDEAVFNRLGNVKPSMIMPACIDIPQFSAGEIGSNPEQLFYIGALDWVPNQEGLLWFINNCWSILKTKLPEVSLHIAGRNASASFLKKVLREGVTYQGEVPDAKEFMKSYGIMIVPLLSGSGMRIKIIEGMALGKPIVTTPIGAEGIPATHRENICIADNEYSFVNEIERLITDKNLCAKISQKAISFIRENYDNIVLAKKLSEFYKTHST
ncbi:MAG: glycosyltransferase family 4 protein [Bacteroidales bacterium]|nr:glycosyltransferase family 4 protein [Bacteroidales bacterium]HOY37733.1 glycosyltransferase family 4 protein [Bacteroidales bacterium]HQP04239.1 glycosyltransferase family 4 protein [Bacteroidales bacterium]